MLQRHDHLITMSREPIQSPHFGAILCNNIMGHPTLKCSFEGGNPDKSKKLRYSLRHKLLLLTPISIRVTSTLLKQL
jgi:hypothetical protein